MEQLPDQQCALAKPAQPSTDAADPGGHLAPLGADGDAVSTPASEQPVSSEKLAKEQEAETAATRWAAQITIPFVSLSKEIWTALNAVKCEGDPEKELHWKELEEIRIGTRSPFDPPPPRRVAATKQDKQTEKRAAEARWRRHLWTGACMPDPQVMGEALDLLARMQHRLPPSMCPNVWRLIKAGTPAAADPFNILTYPERLADPAVGGLAGRWRLVHQQSNGKDFLSWDVDVKGPAFSMKTDPSKPRRAEGLRKRSETVTGDVSASGALFSFQGLDQDGRPVSASFQSPGGHVPSASSFNFAYGLILRVGSNGLCCARAVLTRGQASDDEVGSFSMSDVDGRSLNGLGDDMATIAGSVSPEAKATTVLASLFSADK